MRILIFFVMLIAFIPNVKASLQTIKLTPAALTKWTVTGMNLNSQNTSSEITILASAQLAHTFKSSTLAVSFATQPTLGKDSGTWPVFEIGSAALVFSSDNGEGHLVLAVDDAAAVDLPGTFVLDADGHSVEPVVIGLSRVGSILRVDAFGKSFEFSVKNEPSTTLVISAGIATEWVLQNFDITADSSVFSFDLDEGHLSDGSGKSKNNSKNTIVRKSALTAFGSESYPTTADTESKQKTSSAGGTLEIYTPSAVRLGRVENVRTAAMEIQSK
ncbi:MAG TPA: hypothetical protein VGM66_05720 [Candidatus Udaeobacter sp.]|jgi:hypothetical protein